MARAGPGLTGVVVDRFNKPSNRLTTSVHCLSRQCAVPCGRMAKVLASVNARRLTRVRVVYTVVCRLAGGLSPRRVRHSNFTPCCISRALTL